MATLNFGINEYRQRIEKCYEVMQSNDIDLLYITDPSNMVWISGYDGWSFYVHQGVLLHMDNSPIWFGRELDANGAVRTVHMPASFIVSYPDYYVQNPEHHPMDYLSTIIKEYGWDKLRIGVEKDNYYFSAGCLEKLRKNLPEATFLDSTNLVNWLRIVKSPTETNYLRIAARIADNIHTTIIDKIEPGLPKNQLVADIYHTAISGVNGYGGDYPAIVPMLPSGEDASAAHLTWNDKPLELNTGTFFEIAGCYKRYHCPLARTIYLGKPPKKYLDVEMVMLEGISAALAAVKPGNTCEQIELAWKDVISRYDINKNSRCGYSIGIGYPPDWGEHTASIRAGDKTVLKQNMAFHLIPALWFDDWGIEISESFIVTNNGVEVLCNTPRKLFVKE